MYCRILFFVTYLLLVSCDDADTIYIDNEDDISVIDTDCIAIIEYNTEDFTIKRRFHGEFTKAPVQVLTAGDVRMLDNALYQFLAFQMFKDMV